LELGKQVKVFLADSSISRSMQIENEFAMEYVNLNFMDFHLSILRKEEGQRPHEYRFGFQTSHFNTQTSVMCSICVLKLAGRRHT
jgi:hypothetical protein